jgi:flagellar basal body-associated protein FliL
MQSEPVSQRKSLLKNPLVYSSAVLAAALLTVVYVMVSRWQDASARERQAAQERAEKQKEQDKMAVEQLGGKDFAILSFYASPSTVRRGESTQLCYGVSNAKKVRLEPQTQPVWPSVAHCVDVSPSKSITYTLTIEDAAGHTQSQDIDVKVR